MFSGLGGISGANGPGRSRHGNGQGTGTVARTSNQRKKERGGRTEEQEAKVEAAVVG